MPPYRRLHHLALALCCAGVGVASADEAVPSTAPAASASASAAAKRNGWEGVVGVTANLHSGRLGDGSTVFKLRPAFYLRYGRLTITNTSGFVSRRTEDVVRGLGVDLLNSDRVSLGVALRYDGGRPQKSNDAYKGLGNIKPTLRVRLLASRRLDGPWRMGASWNVDTLGRGGGGFGDLSLGWEHPLSPDTTLTVGSSLNIGDRRYMQTYFGISPAQSLTSVYAPYNVRAGVRDIGTAATLRHDIGSDWTLLASAGVSRRLGQAAASPLTRNPNGWGLSAAAGWRF